MAWLPFSDRVEVNTCKLFLEDLNLQGSFPVFMQDLLRNLNLVCAPFNCKSEEGGTFDISVTGFWNSLPNTLRKVRISKTTFRKAAHVYFLPTVGTKKWITLTKWRLIMIRLLHCLDCNAETVILIFLLCSTRNQNAS